MSYTEELMKYDLLTEQEEQELAKKIADGDNEALDRLICSNLRLVTKIANAYKSPHVDMEDLIQAGNMGLVKAARRYKPGTGARFQTFAQYDIKHDIRDCLSKMASAVSMSIGTYGRSHKARKTMEKLGKDCTIEQIARACGRKKRNDIQATLRGGGIRVSLTDKVGADGKRTYLDLIEDERQDSVMDKVLRKEQMSVLFESLDCLDKEERFVIDGLFGLNGEKKKLLRELGDELRKTAERIRQIKESALSKLHAAMSKKLG